MPSMRASISVVAALLLGVGAAQAGAATTVQPVSITASYTGVNWHAAAHKYPEPLWAQDSGYVGGIDSAQMSKPLSLTSAGGATVSGPIALALDSSSGVLVMRLAATLACSPGAMGSVDFNVQGLFTYVVPDVGQALTAVLVVAGSWDAVETAISPIGNFQNQVLQTTVTISSLTLGRPGYGIDGLPGHEPLQLARIGPPEGIRPLGGSSGGTTGQIVSLIPGDTVQFEVVVNFALHFGWDYGVTMQSTFEGPLMQLSLVSPGSPTPPSAACKADLDGNGVVNFADLAKMKSVFFQPCAP